MRPILTTIIFCLLFSCVPDFTSDEPGSKKDDNVKRSYYPDGTIKAEVPIENRKKNGLAKAYYKDGKLRQSIEYKNGYKHGEAKTFYENGHPYQVSRYMSGKLHGIRERYHEDGQLMSEVPYFDGRPAKGLKEYLLDGTLKKKYPYLIVNEEDRLLKENKYLVHFKVSDGNRRVKFYVGKLDENGTLPRGTLPMEDNGKGIGTMKFTMPPGTFIMEEVPVIAEITTLQGNIYYIEHQHNLSIENRNY